VNTRNRNALVIVLGILGLLLLCCCLAILGVNVLRPWAGGPLSGWGSYELVMPGQATASDTFSRRLEIDSPAVVVINAEVGDVTVRAGADGVVVVEAGLQAQARNRNAADDLLRRISVEADSSGARATIRVDVPDGLMGASARVDLTITVPAEARLELGCNVGDIKIQRLEGEVSVSNNVGNISYDGRLPSSGSVELTTNVGNVAMLLDGGGSFRLNAVTDIGRIDSDLRLESDDSGGEQGWVGERLSGSVGDDPRASVVLRTNTGNIEIHSR